MEQCSIRMAALKCATALAIFSVFSTHLLFAGSINGKKFQDLNGNGVKDINEPGLAGWSITLTVSVASPPSPVTVTTDSLGAYSFTGLDPATYVVSESQQTGWQQTLPGGDGTYTVVLGSSGQDVTDKDFGNARLPSLRGQKFNDLNNNGLKDPGEPGISGWSIRLEVTTASPPPPVIVSTDDNGNYSFNDLSLQSYHITELAEPGWSQTMPGGSGGYDITPGLGDVVTGLDFGNHNPSITASASIRIKAGWNLISVPLIVPDYHVHALFPMAISVAYGYSGAYVVADPLENGPGYLIKFASDTVITMVGSLLANQSISISPGWNLIGTTSYPQSVSAIGVSPPGNLNGEFWEYAPTGFSLTKSLVPGQGYWTYANGSGTLDENSTTCYGHLPPLLNDSPSPPCGSTIIATAGNLLHLTLSTRDPLNDSVTIVSSTLPSGASTLPELPATGNFDSVAFFWTPTHADTGLHSIEFTVTNNCGLASSCSYIISVQSITSFAIPITFSTTDRARTVTWGLNPGATACLDSLLGERKFPPVPPDLDARFNKGSGSEQSCLEVGNNMNLHRYDSRVQVDTFRLTLISDASSVSVVWPDLNRYYAGPVHLINETAGFNVDMKAQTSFTISDPAAGGQSKVITSNPYYLVPPPLPPTVTSLSADNIFPTSATLHGTANPNNFTTNVWFEYGNTSSYGHVTPPTPIGGGTSEVPLSYGISSLMPINTYHFRAVAQNINGISFGDDRTVTTPPIQGPAQLTIPLTIQDQGGSNSKSLRPLNAGSLVFGLDPAASYCLDSTLGELQLPPIPPQGIFDIRFLDPRTPFGPCFGNGMNLDVRRYIDSAQVDTYEVYFQPGSWGYPMSISWPDLNSRYAGPVTMSYASSGIVTINMKLDSVAVVTDTSVHMALIVAAEPIAPPPPPIPLVPPQNSINQDLLNYFSGLSWQPVSGATAYHVQVATDPTFTALLIDNIVTQPLISDQVLFHSSNVHYYWRVASVKGSVEGQFCPTQNFSTYPSTDAQQVIVPISFRGRRNDYPYVRYFGVAPGGSKCLDPQLGEFEAPPPPPVLDPRITPAGSGACPSPRSEWIDMRGYFSAGQLDTYFVRLYADVGDYPIVVGWPDLNSKYNGSVTLTYTGDTGKVTINMKTTNVITIKDSTVTQAHIYATGPNISGGGGGSLTDSTVLALWHFDEGSGTILHDASVYHNDGEIHNATWVPGIAGNALHFNGLTSYVLIPSSASLKPDNNFMIEAWFSLDTLRFSPPPPDTGHAVILSTLGPYPTGGGYQFDIRDGGQFQFDYRAGNPISNFSERIPTPLSRHFYHVAISYQRTTSDIGSTTTITTYLDGSRVDQVSFPQGIHYTSTPNFYIGTNTDGRAVGSIGAREFPGTIDEIRITRLAAQPPPPPPPPGVGLWNPQTSGTNKWLLATFFQDTSLGWASGFDGTLLKTTNAGAAWVSQPVPTNQHLWSIDFPDRNNGWVVGDNGTIIHTTNGGSSWIIQPSGNALRLECVDFINDSVGWIAGGQTGPGTILKTTNGGTTWTTQLSNPSYWLLFVRFLDDQTGWVTGADGVILKTTNGGSTWVPQNSGTSQWILSLSILTPTTLVAVGDYRHIIRSTDAGSTWTEILNLGSFRLEEVRFSDPNYGLAVGQSGTVLSTTNGGMTWLFDSSRTSEDLYSVYPIDPMHAWAVGFNGTILSKSGTASGISSSSRYRTFSETDYSKVAKRLRSSSTPTAANVRDATFTGMGWFSRGLYLGIPRPDSAYDYGWLFWRRNLIRLPRFLPHTAPARGFDTYIAGHPWHISRYNPSVQYHNNHLAGEQFVLKFNVGASDLGITPPGFGELLFDDPQLTGNPCNGLTIRQIITRTDSALTFWKGHSADYFFALDSALSRVNRAFLGTIDSFTIVPLHVNGTRALGEVPYLHPNPFAHPVIIPPIDDEGFLDVPGEFALHQNYPNPFNPLTVIEFNIPGASRVSLQVFNVLGQEVATLIENETMDEGLQSVEFDASALPTGIYFYRLRAIDETSGMTSYNQVRKMVLIK